MNVRDFTDRAASCGLEPHLRSFTACEPESGLEESTSLLAFLFSFFPLFLEAYVCFRLIDEAVLKD